MVPEKNHPGWRELIAGSAPLEAGSFALRMTLARLRSEYSRDASALERCIDEIHAFFARHEELVATEINHLFPNR